MSVADIKRKMEATTPPFQPHILAGTTDYQDRLLPWNPVCIKGNGLLYQFKTKSEGETNITFFPDACMNIIFKCDPHDPQGVVSGIFLDTKAITLAPNTTYFGLKPYSCLGVKQKDFSYGAFTDTWADFKHVFPEGDMLLDKLVTVDNFEERTQAFMAYARQYLIDPNYLPNIVDWCAALMCANQGGAPLEDLSDTMGYSNRYLRSKFKENYGVSPKKYSEMMRLQNIIKKLSSDSQKGLTMLATESGFFDQAHFSKSFSKYTHITPTEYRRTYQVAVAGKTK